MGLFTGATAAGTSPTDYSSTPAAQDAAGDAANTYRTGAMGLTALGGIGKAYATYQTGQANATIDRYNAQLDQIQAQQAIEKGNEQANIQEEKGVLLQGAQKAAMAGGGVIAGAGTGGAVIASGQATSAMDQMMTRLNAQRAAFGYQSRSSIDQVEADYAKKAGDQGAVAALVDTASRENLYADPNYRQRSGGYGSGMSF